MHVQVDPDLCTGHALCHLHGPDVYALDEFGYNTTSRDVPTALREQARRGAVACPEGAIELE